VIAVLSVRHGDRAFARRTWILLALSSAVSVAIFMAWALPATRASGGRVLPEFIGREVLGRAIAPREGHGMPWLAAPFFYPAVLAIGFLPWSVYLIAALRRARDRWRDADLLTTLGIAGSVIPVALFALAATKLPHYVLPALPPMALLCAAASVTPGRSGRPDLFGRLLVSTIAIILLIGTIALPMVERRKAIPEIARVANAACPADCDVSVAGIDEPSLIFLLDRPHVTRLDTPDAIASWVRSGAPGVLVARSERWDAAPDSARRNARELARARGLDVVHGGQMTLVVVSRGAR
jgi:hypothetical protein